MATPDSPAAPGRRTYRQVARADRARDTRARVVAAAGELFETRGYAGTTVREIAAAAGVSVETVTGLGRKRDLLFAALQDRFLGEGVEASLLPVLGFGAAGTPPVPAEPPEAIVARLVAAATEAFGRSVGIWRAFTAAANVEEEVAAVRAEALAARRRDLLALLDVLAAAGSALPRDRGALADAIGLLTSHDAYDHLVSGCGWTPAAYRDWATGAVLAEIARAAPGS